jgi:hypothetical protein
MTTRRSAAVYEFPDRLIVIADHLSEAGFWRAGLPVVRLLTSAADDVVGQAVQRALTEAPARIPATPWKEYAPVRLALASAAGFRSWGPFDRRARLLPRSRYAPCTDQARARGDHVARSD